MIKINLSTSQKQIDISNVGGFDFTKVKIVPLLIAFVLMYVPDFFLVPIWETEITEANDAITSRQAALSKLKKKVTQSQDLEKQIRELKAQEENLGKKLTAVKQAISEKKNPSPLLLYLSKNMPNELWIKELVIDNDVMTIKGEALTYISIGNFVTSLKSSVFIKDANIVNTSSKVRDPDKKRIESFEVKFTIGRFEQ